MSGPAAVDTARPAGGAEELDPRRWIALAVVLTAAFMVLLDISIVNVAIPSIQASLHATFSQIEFVLAGYALAYAVVLITGGRLGDIVGRKRMFMLGMGGFVLASALCGLAQSPGMLVGSRVLQGLMAALMYPQVLAVVQVSFPPRERGTALAIFGATIGIATIAGPLVGGLLINAEIGGTANAWRPIFLVNLPVGIGALVAAALLFRETRAPMVRRLDLVGVAIATVGLFMVAYPLVEGRDAGWPWWTYTSMVGAVPVLALFVLYERRMTARGADPLVALTLFEDRAFNVGLGIAAVFFSGVPSFFFTFSLFLQIGLGYSALHAGLTTMPFAIGSFIGSALSVRVAARLGKRILSLGCALLVAGMVGVILTVRAAGTGVSSLQLAPSLLVCGLGLGSVVAPLVNVILAGINPRQAGSASGVLSTVQQIGGAIGVAVIGVIFFGALGGHADAAFDGARPQLVADLAVAGVPSSGATAIADGLHVCFHDRANATDPTVPPPSCAAGQRLVGTDPRVAAIVARAAATARAVDYADTVRVGILYNVGVFALTFVLVGLLPNVRPGQRPGGPGH